jgi:autotransporter translocation and assembly factor TamB
VSAVVSGAMVAAGNMRKVAVEGRLTSDRVEVNTEAGLPPGITSISVQEVGPRPHHGSVSRKQKAAAPSEAATDIALDMSLHLPGRVFVRGRGLDSEWEGDITVTGTASAPKIVGKLTSRRGDFDLAGKRFRIQPSTIDLQPAATGDVDASLAITARYEGKSITAIIEITGSATKPQLALKSVPEMPQDEILSRLLFNKSRASVTPGEAIQLAQAASSLSGGGGFDALGTLRKAMGVDVLRVASDEGATGPSLETGKYVTENVYVGVRQGTDTTQTALSVEVDVLKNVAVESEVRPNGGNKLGAKYKIDY